MTTLDIAAGHTDEKTGTHCRHCRTVITATVIVVAAITATVFELVL